MDNKRSFVITQGAARAPNRAMLRAVGFGDGDFDKPIIGIANGYSTITPCNAGLNVLTEHAEAATRAADAMPQTFRRFDRLGRYFHGNAGDEVFINFA